MNHQLGVIAVLLTAPQIPAGMTGFHWNGPESTRMRLESPGMGLASTGMNAFLQELITQQNKTKKILVIKDRKSTRLNSSHVVTSRMPSSA